MDRVYELLCFKAELPREYEFRVKLGALYTARWDDPADFSIDEAGLHHLDN